MRAHLFAPSRHRAVLMLALLLLAMPAVAPLAQTIGASPDSRGPGADFVASMSELRVGVSYGIDLVQDTRLGATYTLEEFAATQESETHRLRVPAAAEPGAYRLELRTTTFVLATTAFSVAPPLAIRFSPTAAAPGDLVEVTVSGTHAGQLSLDYAGQPLPGPVAVGEGSWTGSFLVPTDRPGRLPATVPVVATNWLGRSVSARGSASFSALAERTGAPFALSFTTPPPETVERGEAVVFSGTLQDAHGRGPNGRTSFFWRADDGSRMVPIDGGVEMDAAGNFTLSGGRARAPDEFMDGVPRMGAGTLVGVVDGNHEHLGTGRDLVVESGRNLGGPIDLPPPPLRFTIRVVGVEGTDRVPLGHVYLDVPAAIASGFSDPGDGPPGQSELDLLGVRSQLAGAQAEHLDVLGGLTYTHGCPISFGAKFTETSGARIGEADFEFDPEAVKGLQVMQATKEMGEIRTVDFGAPMPGIDVMGAQHLNKRQQKGLTGSELFISVRIASGQRGYGNWGYGSEGVLAGIPMYDDEHVTLVFDDVTRELVQVYGAYAGNTVTVEDNVVTVPLPKLPDTSQGVVPYNLRIENMTAERPQQIGHGAFVFRGMNAFPASRGWTSGHVDVRNVGREFRFAWETGFGAIQNATLVLTRPQGSVFQTSFVREGQSPCHLSGIDDYVAQLPDMTDWPANPDNQDAYCRKGWVIVQAVGDRHAATEFSLCTKLPPSTLRASQVDAASLVINAKTQTYTGRLDIPGKTIVANDADMAEWEVPPQTNAAKSAADFDISIDGKGMIIDDLGTGTDHTISNEAAEEVNYAASSFGFDGPPSLGNVERQTILDTGLIPLFRYPWGFSPIAGAVFGADFWMAATLGFYGQLDVFADGGNMMNATIDPTLNGGVNVFFDLDILFGLVSASVSANPQVGLSIKEVIGKGGLADDRAGVCFGFDMDVAMEICAVVCAEDEFNLFRVRADEQGDHCQVDMKALGIGPGIGGGLEMQPALDLGPPRLWPSASAAGGSGFNLVVEATADGEVLAHHLSGATVLETRAIATSTHSVQHIDVEFLTADTALAVWSQSTLERSVLETEMAKPGALRAYTDNLARAQALYYSWFDGSDWSTPEKVPVAQAATGKPKIASNRCLDFACTASGSPRAYLVWEHEATGNIATPKLEVWGSRFLPPASFGTANRISGAGSTDMHPDVLWLGTRPLVAWVSSALPHYQGSASRRIRYRMVDFPILGGISSPIQTPAFPTGAGWPALGKIDDSTAVLAFTIAQDESVVGNRNAVHAARGTCSGNSCTWSFTELRDPAGRQIRGERPVVAVDADDGVVVSLRGLAYGPDANGETALPIDAVGMVLGSGEHISVRVSSFGSSTSAVAVQHLSNDGLQHWRPEVIFDPAADAFIALTRAAEMPTAKHAVYDTARAFTRASPAAAVQRKALGPSGLSIGVLPAVADLRIERLELAADWLAPGTSAAASVDVRNAGSAFDPALNGEMLLSAAWDAPPGVGIPAMKSVSLPALAAGGTRTVALQAEVPPDHASDHRRTLFVEVRSQVPTEEANAADNVAQVTVGQMPVPTGLLAAIKINSPMVRLQWDPIDDPRVVGYRVYRRAENGEFVPYGSSEVAGYADLFAGFSNPEEYRVTSYSINGIESEASAITLAIPQQTSGLFRDGFELGVD